MPGAPSPAPSQPPRPCREVRGEAEGHWAQPSDQQTFLSLFCRMCLACHQGRRRQSEGVGVEGRGDKEANEETVSMSG